MAVYIFFTNRFGTFLGLAHAAVTAEGDNCVLMQKVAKERLSSFKPLPEENLQEDVSNLHYLENLIIRRENIIFMVNIFLVKKLGRSSLESHDQFLSHHNLVTSFSSAKNAAAELGKYVEFLDCRN